jgi:hypothetical protein
MTREILAMLKKQGISQKELAKRLDIAESTLSKKMKFDNWREPFQGCLFWREGLVLEWCVVVSDCCCSLCLSLLCSYCVSSAGSLALLGLKKLYAVDGEDLTVDSLAVLLVVVGADAIGNVDHVALVHVRIHADAVGLVGDEALKLNELSCALTGSILEAVLSSDGNHDLLRAVLVVEEDRVLSKTTLSDTEVRSVDSSHCDFLLFIYVWFVFLQVVREVIDLYEPFSSCRFCSV